MLGKVKIEKKCMEEKIVINLDQISHHLTFPYKSIYVKKTVVHKKLKKTIMFLCLKLKSRF